MPLSRNAQIGFRIVGCALTSSGRNRRSPLPTFAGDCNAPTTYFDETATKRSGRPKHAKGSGTAHRQTFLLKVDGQIKTSFDTKEPASTAGAAIKKAFPIVVVTVVDTEKSSTEIINA